MAKTDTPAGTPSKFVERAFVLSLLAKAALAILQLGSGLALLILPQKASLGLIAFLANNELAEDPSDFIAQSVATWVARINPQVTHFYEIYLLGHGALHSFVVLSLLMRWRLAYPFSLGSLILFVAYQIWQYLKVPDTMVLVLTAIDIFVIVIVVLEHHQTRRQMTKPDIS